MLAVGLRAVASAIPRKRRGQASIAALALILAGCGGGLETAELEIPDVPSGGDDLEFTPPEAGQTVGVMETRVPAVDEFTLRGTLPLQPGVFGDADTKYTLAVLDHQGNAAPTQVEIVSRFPDPADGADVVELIARLPRPAGATTGQRYQFEVVVLPNGYTIPQPSGNTVAALNQGTLAVPNSIQALVDDPQSLRLRTFDVFGHAYPYYPLQQANHPKVLRYGPLATTVRTYNVMKPAAQVGGGNGTLAHHFGVHAYFTTLAEEEVLLVDLRFNNGPDGNLPGTTDDDPMGKLYFSTMELFVPAGYTVVSMFDDLAAGAPFSAGLQTGFPLIAGLPGGDLHVSKPQAQFHRRLAIAPASKAARAEAILRDMEGVAFCRAGTDPDSGDDYYSWWNEFTARYFAQNFQLPSLDHVGLGNIRSQLASELAQARNAWDNGTSTNNGQYPIPSPRLGYTHPWGVSYGGMTGGNEIFLWDGVRTAAAASYEGLELTLLTHRMSSDRHCNMLWGHDGEPTKVQDWLDDSGAYPWIPMNLTGTIKSGNNPFGYNEAPTFQSDAAAAQGRRPDYEDELLSYDPHLTSHLIRYTRLAQKLVWLMNDQMAKDDLHMQAEIEQLSYTPYYKDAFGGYGNSSMRADIVYTTQHPNNGFTFGRTEGWAADTMASFYAVAPLAWRDGARSWFTTYIDTVAAGQVTCTGLIYAAVSPKLLNSSVRGAQAFETSICDNGLMGVLESVFRGADTAYQALTIDILRDYYDGFIGDLAWHRTLPGPANMYTVGPASDSAAAFCSSAGLGPETQEFLTNDYQTMSTLGYAYHFTGDPTFLDRADEMLGGDAFTELMADGTQNVMNRAALLSVVQKLNGVL
jgi:hypothetical protein